MMKRNINLWVSALISSLVLCTANQVAAQVPDLTSGGVPVNFASDARIALAKAIADAEANSPATLKILRWRAGVTTTVSVTLETLGAYSATAPYNCPKSAAAKDTTVVFDGQPGKYLFEVTMSDSYGLTEVSETVAVTLYEAGGTLPPNTAPTANPQSITVGQGTPTQIVLTGSDPEGYPLVYTVTSGPDHGTLSGVAPNLVYTPEADYQGADTITFEVMDSEGQVDTAAVNITVNTGSPIGLAIYGPFDYSLGELNGASGLAEVIRFSTPAILPPRIPTPLAAG